MTREEIYSRSEELDKRASLGGGVDKIEKQHAQGKLTARERIGMLLDKGTFNELDKLVNHRCTNTINTWLALTESPSLTRISLTVQSEVTL